MARAFIIVVLSTITLSSGFRMNGFGQNSGYSNVRYNPPPQPSPIPPPPPPTVNIKSRIKVQPPAMPSFNFRAWLGPWVYQYWKAPCSWSVAEEFTDFTHVLELQGKQLITHDTSRNKNFCNTVTGIMEITGPGQFAAKDLTGDNWSGVIVVPATDYKSFSISWVCTKRSAFDGTCDDPGLAVKTRQRKVSAKVLQKIDSALQQLFGVSINELTKIKHGQPCPRGTKQG